MKKNRFEGDEDRFSGCDCGEAKEYCGKCPKSSCIWLMGEAFKEEVGESGKTRVFP